VRPLRHRGVERTAPPPGTGCVDARSGVRARSPVGEQYRCGTAPDSHRSSLNMCRRGGDRGGRHPSRNSRAEAPSVGSGRTVGVSADLLVGEGRSSALRHLVSAARRRRLKSALPSVTISRVSWLAGAGQCSARTASGNVDSCRAPACRAAEAPTKPGVAERPHRAGLVRRAVGRAGAAAGAARSPGPAPMRWRPLSPYGGAR
jgi:hypothetical protein